MLVGIHLRLLMPEVPGAELKRKVLRVRNVITSRSARAVHRLSRSSEWRPGTIGASVILVVLVGALLLPTLNRASASASVIVVRPRSPIAGEQATVEVRNAGARSRPRVEAIAPTGRKSRVALREVRRGLWRGAFRFNRVGRWHLRLVSRGTAGVQFRLIVRVRAPSPTPPPLEFGPLGRPRCEPASPRYRGATAFPAIGEVFGTTIRGELWALFSSLGGGRWASSEAAIIEQAVGQELKIVFRFTGSLGALVVTGPDGKKLLPIWGPRAHSGSDWARPGSEWGTGFIFPEPGCWRIRISDGVVAGDVWLKVLS
jgi:hypothetical protein